MAISALRRGGGQGEQEGKKKKSEKVNKELTGVERLP